MSIYKYYVLKGIGLSERCILECLPRLSSETYPPGSVLLRKGDKPQFWTHIVSGMVGAIIPETSGKIIPVGILGDGTWFGESAILNNQSATLEFICLGPTRILNLPVPDVLHAFQHQPEFARYLTRLISWRHQRQSERLILMNNSNPQLRVVMGLALFAERLLNCNSHLPSNENEEELDIRLKQELLASVCGVSRGVFSESVQQLAASGLLSVNYASLKLQRIQNWCRFSENYRQQGLSQAKPSTQELIALILSA